MYPYISDEAIMFRINQSILDDCEAGNLSAYDFVLSFNGSDTNVLTNIFQYCAYITQSWPCK